MREDMARVVREAVRASDGRAVPATHLHVTLAFLGSVADYRVVELAPIAQAAALGPVGRLELAFDRLEFWRAAQILCALPSQPPAQTAALARSLQERLAACGFAPDRKSPLPVGSDMTDPFRPHVTLARKVQRPPRILKMQPVTWGFTDFVLVDSRRLPEGSVYTILERFPLVPPQPNRTQSMASST